MGKVKEYLYGEDGNEEQLLGIKIDLTLNGKSVPIDSKYIRIDTADSMCKDYEIAKMIHEYEKTNDKKTNDKERRTLINKFND